MTIYSVSGDGPVDSNGNKLFPGDSVILRCSLPNPAMDGEMLPAGTRFKCLWYWYGGERGHNGTISPAKDKVELSWSHAEHDLVRLFHIVVDTKDLIKVDRE